MNTPRVEVFGVPAAPVWRTLEGLTLTGPAHFRFDAPYRAMEEIVGTKPA